MNADSSAVIAGESGWVEVKGGRAGINGDGKKIKLKIGANMENFVGSK